MNADLLRLVDSISRDKNIEKEAVYVDLEVAMLSAAHKVYEEAEDVVIAIDRVSGDITALADGKPIDMKTLGRIAAQTAKQVMMQKIREDERNSIFEEFSERVGTIVTGTVARFEGGSLTVNLNRAEGFLPRSEQIPGDSHHPGERIRAMVLDVREEQNRVKIVLTQTHPDYIRKLFELEVPEVAERIIEIKALAREAGYRTKIAVSSIDSKVDAVGACVGVRGSRIRNIVDELGGEKIDIVRWNESSQVLISNALKPAEVRETFLCFELGRATVLVDEEQLSLAIGKRGQNVRLAARLTGWDIDICTPPEYDRNMEYMEQMLGSIEGVPELTLDKMLAMGIVSVADIAEVGVEPYVNDLEMNEELAAKIVEKAGVEAERIAAEKEAAKKAQEEARAAEAARQAELAASGESDTDSATESAAAMDAGPDSASGESASGESAAAESASGESGSGDALLSATESSPSEDSPAGDSPAGDSASGDSTGDSMPGVSTTGAPTIEPTLNGAGASSEPEGSAEPVDRMGEGSTDGNDDSEDTEALRPTRVSGSVGDDAMTGGSAGESVDS